MIYETICEAILKENGYDSKAKNLMRRWIMLFERTNVPGFDRDEFMDVMIECKKEVENETKNKCE